MPKFRDVGDVIALKNEGSGPEKTWSVPSRTKWRLLSVFVEITTTSSPGSRQFALELRDQNDVVFWRTDLGATIAASQTGVVRTAMNGPDFPLVEIYPGWDFVVRDTAAVSSSDQAKVRALIMEVS